MRTKLLHEADGKRTFAVILETGDEAMQSLLSFATTETITGAQFSAIGAVSRASLAYFDWETKRYATIDLNEQAEVASLMGDVAVGPDAKSTIHAHAVLGRRDGAALAGHVQSAHVRPTLEVILTEVPAHLCKHKDPESGLALFKL